MDKVIGRNGWTDSDQANYEEGIDDAKFGEVMLRSNPAYKRGYEIGLALKSMNQGTESGETVDANVF